MDFNTNLPAIRKVEFNGKQVYAINSWELFQKLGRSNYSSWCKHEILDMGKEGVDYILITSSYLIQRGRRRKEYLLSTEFSKHLVLQSRSEFGKWYRSYLIDFEKEHLNKVVKLSQTTEAAKFFTTFLEGLREYSPTAHLTMGAKVSKEVFGIEVPSHFLPKVEVQTWSASQIAKEYGSTAQTVGRIATQLGLKRPPYAEQRLSVATHTNKEVSMYFYNQEAVDLIVSKLGSQTNHSLF